MSAPTTIPGTNTAYRRRAHLLRIRVARLRGLHPEDVLPIHIVEHVLSHAAEPDRIYDVAKPGIGTGDSSPKSAAIPKPKPKQGMDQSATQSGYGGESQGTRRRIGSNADESPRTSSGHKVYSRATFRQYKAALLADFEAQLADQSPNLTRADDEQLRHAIERLHMVNQAAFAKRGNATSSLKSKRFSDNALADVMAYLDERVGVDCWAVPLRIWIRASRLTGLRPCEWRYASMSYTHGEGHVLTVRNAKHTNGRGNGPIRTLQLQEMLNTDIDHIREMLQMVEDLTHEMRYSDMQRGVAKYLHSVTRRVLKPSRGAVATWPTLYSLRHQLLADAKLSLTQPEVAAIAGHASDATAGQHYGRRRSGVRAPTVAPSPGDVATVRRRAKPYAPAAGPRIR